MNGITIQEIIRQMSEDFPEGDPRRERVTLGLALVPNNAEWEIFSSEYARVMEQCVCSVFIFQVWRNHRLDIDPETYVDELIGFCETNIVPSNGGVNFSQFISPPVVDRQTLRQDLLTMISVKFSEHINALMPERNAR